MNCNICYYHGNCPDGLLAAYPIWKFNSNALLFPRIYGKQYNYDICKDKNVLFVDFCPDETELKYISSIATTIHIVDHHKSAMVTVLRLNLPNITHDFDMNHSGCYLSFKSYYPDKKDHFLVLAVEDRDLFRTPPVFPNSEQIYKIFCFKYMNFESIDSILQETDPVLYVTPGSLLMEYDDMRAEDAVKYSGLYKFDNKYTVQMTTCDPHIKSIVGYKMYTRFNVDFAVIYSYNSHTDVWYLSCRASNDKDIDLSIICSNYYKGGGHPKAAGMMIYGTTNSLNQPTDKKVLSGTLLDWFSPI